MGKERGMEYTMQGEATKQLKKGENPLSCLLLPPPNILVYPLYHEVS